MTTLALQNVTSINTAFMGMAANNLDGFYVFSNNTAEQLFSRLTIEVNSGLFGTMSVSCTWKQGTPRRSECETSRQRERE